MRRFLSLALGFTIAFQPLAFASSTPTLATLNDNVKLLKYFGNVAAFFNVLEASTPELRNQIQKWRSFFMQKGIDLKKVTFDQLRAEGNDLYIGDNATPFHFHNDRKTFSYKGASVVLSFSSQPNDNLKRMQKSWGQFHELGFSQSTVKMMSWILPDAAAQTNREGQAFVGGMALVALIGSLLAILATQGIKGLLITLGGVAVGIPITIALLFAIGYMDMKYHESSSYIGVKLSCEHGPQLYEQSEGHPNWTSTNNIIVPQATSEQQQQAFEGLRKICEAGPAAVEKFNSALFFTKSKIRNGEWRNFVPRNPRGEIELQTPATR